MQYFIDEGSWVISARVHSLCVHQFYDAAKCLAKRYLDACQCLSTNLKSSNTFSMSEFYFIFDCYIALLLHVGKELEAVNEVNSNKNTINFYSVF